MVKSNKREVKRKYEYGDFLVYSVHKDIKVLCKYLHKVNEGQCKVKILSPNARAKLYLTENTIVSLTDLDFYDSEKHQSLFSS